ncbi:protein kinase [Rathayibacter sp. AY1A5]|uniref:protein kinase domain-containing protein n=1 Tax=Rathayibacter sp. AY1A5 TaxID=2080523 RepID=UPI0015E328BF|nr:protein kinase [Rathayibacter sp. AY1A5]
MGLGPMPFTHEELDAAFPSLTLLRPQLGRGAFKVAYQVDGDQLSVLKVLTEPLPSDFEGSEVDDSVLPERFLRELRAMEIAASPHLGGILSPPQAVQIGDHYYIAYEEPFYNGGTLQGKLASRSLSSGEAEQLLISLLLAVHELWSHRIVHRDIKPGNIVYDGADNAVLIDPGISLHLDLNDITQTGFASPRTTVYSAPEQHEERRYASIDFRTDHFLVGLVVYSAISGKHAIYEPGMDEHQFVLKLLTFDRVDVDELACSSEVRTVLKRLLAPKPNRRYRTTDEPLIILGVL